MNYKVKLILKNVLFAIKKNKLRTILTMIGIIISGVMIIFGTFVMEGYYNGKVSILDNTPKNTILVKTTNENIKKLEDCDIDIYNTYYENIDYLYSMYSCETGKKYFNMRCNLIGASSMNDELMEILDYNVHITKSKLKEGRLINNEDISQNKKVIVINSYVAKIIFNSESAVGKSINIDIGNGESKVENFEIIGVIENSKYDENEISLLKSKIGMNGYENIEYETSAYIPVSVFEESLVNNNTDEDIRESITKTLQYNDLHDVRQTKEDVKTICKENVEIFDYENELIGIKDEIIKYKNIFLIIFSVIFVFSGINIMNVCFFSMKERVSEIGVRKAYGASSTMIIIQFMLEGIIIACISYLISIVIGIVLLELVKDIGCKYWEITLIYNYSAKNLIFPLVLVEFETMIFSIIPCIYASRIKVVEALRFE